MSHLPRCAIPTQTQLIALRRTERDCEMPSVDQQVGRAEEIILDHILASGSSTREEIAQKCIGQGIEIGVRSVSRYLKALAEKGLLKREQEVSAHRPREKQGETGYAMKSLPMLPQNWTRTSCSS